MVRTVDLPDLGAVTDGSTFVADHSGTGAFSAAELAAYMAGKIGSPAMQPVMAAATTDAALALMAYKSHGTGAVARPLVDHLGEVLNAKDFGAVGDGATDDTAELQAAIDAAVVAQVPLYIPPGRYLISSALNIRRGCRIFGSYVEPQQAMFTVPVTPPTGAGTWITLDGSHLVSVFYINPTGTPSNANQAMGVEISHIGVYHTQPAPAGGWAPYNYPPAIDIPAGSDVHLHDICLLNPTVGIRAAGQSAGRLRIERIIGQPLTQGIELDNQTDTVTIRDVHFWVHWSLDANVLAWTKANCTALLLGRVDNPVFDNFFTIWNWVGCEITATANGGVSLARFSKCDWDLCGNPFIINDAVGNHTVFMTGCLLTCPGDTTSTSALTITGGGSGSQVYLSSCTVEGAGNSCVLISSSGNHVRLAACRLFQWDMRNVGNFALQSTSGSTIRADAATLTFSAHSVGSILSGGQCIKEPVLWLSHGVMGAAATSVTVPHLLNLTPDMMLVTPNGGPLGGATRQWWVTATASDFTVHVDVAPGADVAFSVLLGLDVFR
jgi:hypothetical protein